MKKPLPNKPSKLFQILQKLSTPQLTKLSKLVESPYFHQTEGVRTLLVYLRKFHPRYPFKKVSNEVIAKHLFPKSKNGIKKVKNFKTDLMKLVEQFLILQAFSQDSNQQQFLLTQAYQDLQLPQLVNSNLKKLKKALLKSPTQGLPFLMQNLQLLHFQYYHASPAQAFKNQKNLQELLNYLDRYYVSAKYKYVQETIERTAKLNEQFDLPLWEAVQTEAVTFGSSNKQSLVYYYYQLQELNSRDALDQEQFEIVKNAFFNNLEGLDREDQLAIFRYLLNYVIRFLNNGIPQLKELQFDLFKNGVTHDLIIWKNRIPMNTFLNIVVIASACKKFDWLEEFISNYEKYLNPNLHEDVINASNAFIAFHQNKPSDSLAILRNTTFKNLNLEIFCLPLEAKIIFEIFLQDQTYHTAIISRLDSFSKKVSSKYNFSDHKKESYKNYVHFVKRIVQTYNNSKNENEAIKKISNKILKTNPLIHKSWLLEKCDQIINAKVA